MLVIFNDFYGFKYSEQILIILTRLYVFNIPNKY